MSTGRLEAICGKDSSGKTAMALGRALQGFKHGLISPISLSALLWKAPEPVIPSPLITAIADTPFYKVKPSLPPLPAESKKLSRRADAVPWPQKQKPPAFIK